MTSFAVFYVLLLLTPSLSASLSAQRRPSQDAPHAASVWNGTAFVRLGDLSAEDGARWSASEILTVVMMPTAPAEFAWRDMVRRTTGELMTNVVAAGHPVRVLLRFAVGVRYLPKSSELYKNLTAEVKAHGDVALLNIVDGVGLQGSDPKFKGGGDTNKTWYMVDWAVRTYPNLELLFKQDYDTIVDWRRALPAMLGRIFKGVAPLPLGRIYAGRRSPWDKSHECAVGSLYGFSGDIARWIVSEAKLHEGAEDAMTCGWVHKWVATTPGGLDHRGLLYPPIWDHWIHPVKTEAMYRSCIEDHVRGCSVQEGVWPQEQRFRIPAAAHGG